MRANNKFFTPEEVDEQIAFLSHRLDLQHETTTPEARLISHLRQIYAKHSEENTQSLERVWKHILTEQQFEK